MLIELLHRVTPSCQDATALISASMDRTLPLRLRMALTIHILICRGCRAYRRQLLLILNALPESEDNGRPTGEANERLKQAFRTKFQ